MVGEKLEICGGMRETGGGAEKLCEEAQSVNVPTN